MTKNEIMEMARQTGVLAGYEGEPSLLVIFAKGIIDIERDALCVAMENQNTWDIYDPASTAIKVIQARGQA